MVTLNDFVLVVPDEEEAQYTPSGLSLIGSAGSPIVSGIVLSAPEMVVTDNLGFESGLVTGSKIYFLKGDRKVFAFRDWPRVILLRFREIVAVDE